MDTVLYTPPIGASKRHAIAHLVCAIKTQAELDQRNGVSAFDDDLYGGPVASWRRTWIEGDPWRALWAMLRAE